MFIKSLAMVAGDENQGIIPFIFDREVLNKSLNLGVDVS